MNYYECTATKVWDATYINALKVHITADIEHPLCSDKLHVIGYERRLVEAVNVTCKRCIKKMETA